VILGMGVVPAVAAAAAVGQAARASRSADPCGMYQTSFLCYTPFGYFSDRCREHESLVEACKQGYYQAPPMPPPPPVPTGGYEGAVTDPDAVDEVVSRSQEEYNAAMLEAMRRQAANLPPSPTPEKLADWVWIAALGGVAFLVLLVKR